MARKTFTISRKVKARLKQSGIADPSKHAPLGSLPYHVLARDVQELTEGNIRIAKELIALKEEKGVETYIAKIRNLEVQLSQQEETFKEERRAYLQAFKRSLGVLLKYYDGSDASLSEDEDRDFAKNLVRWGRRQIKKKIVR